MMYANDGGLGFNSAEVSGAAKATYSSPFIDYYKIINGYYVTKFFKNAKIILTLNMPMSQNAKVSRCNQ